MEDVSFFFWDAGKFSVATFNFRGGIPPKLQDVSEVFEYTNHFWSVFFNFRVFLSRRRLSSTIRTNSMKTKVLMLAGSPLKAMARLMTSKTGNFSLMLSNDNADE